jgi:histidinol-phosphate aminotransferase
VVVVPKRSLATVPAYAAGKQSLGESAVGAIPTARLAANENPYGPLPAVREAMIAAMGDVNRYRDHRVSPLRDAIARFHSVGRDRVLIGAGGGALCERAVLALCNEGDEVIFAVPSYIGYQNYCAVAGARAVTVGLDSSLRHDLAGMLAAITGRTRIVLVCNPNNPTGTVVGQAELRGFIEAVPDRCLVLLDEAYIDFADDSRSCGFDLLDRCANLLIARTFSKNCGLAGLRIGYLIGHPETTELISRSMGWFQLNVMSEAAALASLAAAGELAERIASIRAGRRLLIRLLRELGYEVPDCQGNFVWLPLAAPEVRSAVTALEEQGILSRPFPEGLRITVGTDAENHRVAAVLARLPRSRGRRASD